MSQEKQAKSEIQKIRSIKGIVEAESNRLLQLK
jgi:hypothetical protein